MFEGLSVLDTGSRVLSAPMGLDLLFLCGIVKVAIPGCEIPRVF